MAAAGPATGTRGEDAVVFVADDDGAGSLDFGVALEAEIVVALGEECAVDRAVRVVANDAAFAKSFVLENEGAALLAMAAGAAFVHARHAERRGAAEAGVMDVGAVWIVAIDTVHAVFDDRMMLRKVEFAVGLDVAIEAGGGVFAGVDDETAASAAGFDMHAAGAVAAFAAGHAGEINVVLVEAAVSAGGKLADDVCVAIDAGGIADKMRAGDFGRRNEGALSERGASSDQEADNANESEDGKDGAV